MGLKVNGLLPVHVNNTRVLAIVRVRYAVQYSTGYVVTKLDSLFCRVIQLILPWAPEARLDTGISPNSLHDGT